jgi:hypothetical protein
MSRSTLSGSLDSHSRRRSLKYGCKLTETFEYEVNSTLSAVVIFRAVKLLRIVRSTTSDILCNAIRRMRRFTRWPQGVARSRTTAVLYVYSQIPRRRPMHLHTVRCRPIVPRLVRSYTVVFVKPCQILHSALPPPSRIPCTGRMPNQISHSAQSHSLSDSLHWSHAKSDTAQSTFPHLVRFCAVVPSVIRSSAKILRVLRSGAV